MAKKYIVDLSEDEVSQLGTLIKTGKRKARIMTRVHILLMASEGKTDKTIAEADACPCLYCPCVLERNLYLGV